MKATYKPEIFDVTNEDEARNIILTPEASLTTTERWEKETPFLVQDIAGFLQASEDSLVLDFGCGIGRLSRELVSVYGCHVLGLDTSATMRQLAVKYVDNDRFTAVSKSLLNKMAVAGLKVDACLCVWVLQHCPDVMKEISLIKSLLKENGSVYVLNTDAAVIPTDRGWLNNGVNLKTILEDNFYIESYSCLPVDCTSIEISENSFIAKLRTLGSQSRNPS